MQTEFYRSQSEFLPTFSLMVAVSLAGLNSAVRSHLTPVNNLTGHVQSTTGYYGHYYYGLPEVIDQSDQVQTMQRFAENLLKETEDTPQAVVDILNQHFWDLV